jgi:general secretion pathway protein K
MRGVALVTAMLIVAIAATIATFVAAGSALWLRQAENLAALSQSEALRRAANDYATLLLARPPAAEGARDDLTPQGLTALGPLPTEGGTVKLAIEDAQGRFNLNNLVRGGAPSAPDIGVFQRLLALHGLAPELAEALVDWLDPDDRSRPNGAEDLYYLSLTPSPYRAANRLLVSVEELRLVRGFDAEAVARLRADVIALPQASAINVNTASAHVLAALVPNLPLSAAAALVEQRRRQPFSSPEAFLQALPAQAGRPQAAFAVTSRYFLVHFEYERPGWLRRSVALIERHDSNPRRSRLRWQAPDYDPSPPPASAISAAPEAVRPARAHPDEWPPS